MQSNAALRTEIIGFDSGWGCANFRCEDGPASVNASAILAGLAAHHVAAKWHAPLGLKFLGRHEDVKGKLDSLATVLTALRRLSNTVRISAENGNVPIVIGGDHSSAIGTWSGVVAARKAHRKFGLIWVDAHMDCHTIETSYQGKWGGWWHGQPVTALTGHGLPDLQHIGGLLPKLSPQHISIIGAHSYEPAEVEFAKREGIRVFFLDEVRARGFRACYDEALARANDGTDAFGLTIDMDCFRPEDSPGVGSAEDTGLVAAEVVPVLKSIARHPRFAALELAEFNPHQDKLNKTGQLIENIIKSCFS
ncbi:MAG: arginase [Alphaproteobacteria bacterium]|nr:arginase [Alphaproteobacteria bacterium]